MPHLMTTGPPADGGYPIDSDLHQMTNDGGPPAPDPARWADPDWRDNLGERDTFTDEVPPGPMPRSDASAEWTPIAVGMPPEGVIVDALTSQGRVLRVKWEGRLWRLPGGAHHPCFTPDFWRRVVPVATPVGGGTVIRVGAGTPEANR
jgi:hypothetical protein